MGKFRDHRERPAEACTNVSEACVRVGAADVTPETVPVVLIHLHQTPSGGPRFKSAKREAPLSPPHE